MRIICGVELKGNDAILAVLEAKSRGYKFISEPMKITIIDTVPRRFKQIVMRRQGSYENRL
jgi:hypothetical protein